MAPTRDAALTTIERMQREPELAKLLFEDAIDLFLNGEPDIVRIALRDIVNGTIGFESLAQKINKPSKSIHRMLSLNGNPSMNNISAIFAALRHHFDRKRPARAVKVA